MDWFSRSFLLIEFQFEDLAGAKVAAFFYKFVNCDFRKFGSWKIGNQKTMHNGINKKIFQKCSFFKTKSAYQSKSNGNLIQTQLSQSKKMYHGLRLNLGKKK